MALNFGKLTRIGDNIAKKVIDEILDEGSEILETLIERIKRSDLIEEIIEEVTEEVINAIVEALTGGDETVLDIDDVELDEDEPDEEGVLNPRTEDLDDDEMGIN
tara:strand:+ start:128 stop:442 length:315 start_codon:yes stop_codon:yes gene_type:complete